MIEEEGIIAILNALRLDLDDAINTINALTTRLEALEELEHHQ